jgi:phosphate-selective porin
MKTRKITILSFLLLASVAGFTQEGSFKTSGYIQGQFQWGERNAALRVGGTNVDTTNDFSRFGIRRGRFKLSYENGIASGVFQLDMTEKGVGIKDAYLSVKDPWAGVASFQVGVFNRPFGYEIAYSSSQRETPERANIFKELFPDERDLGAMAVIGVGEKQGLPLNIKLEAGLFAGNGIKVDNDNEKAFISHLSATKTFTDVFQIGGGISYHNEKEKEVLGLDLEMSLISVIGMTKLNGEYLFGKTTQDFNGGYVMLVQDLGRLPLSVAGKYDWVDNSNDYSAIGFGMLWRMNNNVRLQAYYEMIDSKDNADAFTLRLQYKF